MRRFFLLLLLTASPTVAQVPAVHGRVLDAESGLPIRAAVVRLVSGAAAAISDSSGRFQIPLRAPDSLAVSRLGYVPLRFAVAGNDSLALQMSPASVGIEGVTAAGLQLDRIRGGNVCHFPVVYGERIFFTDPLSMLEDYFGYRRIPCGGRAGRGAYCSAIRGTVEPIALLVDGIPQPNGLTDLSTLAPGELSYATRLNGGRTISAITSTYADGLARARATPAIPPP